MGTRCGGVIFVVLVSVRSLFRAPIMLIAVKLVCHMSVHPKCLPHVHTACAPARSRNEPAPNVAPLRKLEFLFCCVRPALTRDFPVAPSMFGRDLVEQVRADAKGEERYIPVIVQKCIDAVDALGGLIFSFDQFHS